MTLIYNFEVYFEDILKKLVNARFGRRIFKIASTSIIDFQRI